MASFIRSNLRTAIPLILARLQSVSGLPPERCFPGWVDEPPDLQADQYFVVEFGGGNADQPTWLGAGKVDFRPVLTVAVLVRTRLILDSPGQALVWLTDTAVGGHLTYVDFCWDALMGADFLVTDADGNCLALPAQFAGWSVPKPDRQRKGWGSSVHRFALTMEQSLTQ